jgi:hypothetical protein
VSQFFVVSPSFPLLLETCPVPTTSHGLDEPPSATGMDSYWLKQSITFCWMQWWVQGRACDYSDQGKVRGWFWKRGASPSFRRHSERTCWLLLPWSWGVTSQRWRKHIEEEVGREWQKWSQKNQAQWHVQGNHLSPGVHGQWETERERQRDKDRRWWWWSGG